MLMVLTFIVTYRWVFVGCFIWCCLSFMALWKMSNDLFIVRLFFLISRWEESEGTRQIPAIYSASYYHSTKNAIMCQKWANVWLLITVSLTELRYRIFHSFAFYAFFLLQMEAESVYGLVKIAFAAFISISSVSINFLLFFYVVDRFWWKQMRQREIGFYEPYPNVYKNV